MAIAKNMNMIRGTKPKTPPTPPMTPEIIKDCRCPSGITDEAVDLRKSKKASNQRTGNSLAQNVKA